MPEHLATSKTTDILRSIYVDNLEILGEWFRRTGKREEIFLASKFGIIMNDNFTLKGFDSSAEHCKNVCNDSLNRMGVDHIDLCRLLLAIPSVQ